MSLEKDYLKDLFTDEVKGCLKSDGDPVGTAASTVSEHNTSENAHNDIRLLVAGLTSRLNALADSDDTTLDQLSELVAYIKANRELIDSITTGKVSVSDIINNLTTNISNKPLSAAQGVALKALIDAITVPTKVSELQNDAGYLTQHQDISDLRTHTENGTVHITDGEREKWNKNTTDITNLSEEIADQYAKKSAIPTKVSQLTNDSGYLTQHQDLSEYAKSVSLIDDVSQAQANLTPAEILQAMQAGKILMAIGGVCALMSHNGTSQVVVHRQYNTINRVAEVVINADKSYSMTLVDLAKQADLPTKVSQLENDSGYLTQHQDISDLTAHTGNSTVHITAAERTKWNQAVTDVGNLSEEIADLKGGVVSVPDYWVSELEAKADAIQVAMEKAGRNKSAFLWYTDAHWANGNSKKSPMILDYLYRNTPMNKTKFGGDIIGDTLLATRDEMKYLYEWRRMIRDIRNHHSVFGNHDMFNLDSVDYENDNYRYAFLLAPEETADMVWGDGNYYYIDNPAEKTRYLHLAYLTSDLTAMLAQGQWIADAIKSVPEGWHIVAIAHRWWQYSSSSTPTTGSIPTYEAEMLDVFDKYNARATRSGSNYFYAQDFTEAKGKVEFCIGGHIHVDHDFFTAGGIPVIITTSDANQNRVPDSTVDSGTTGTITEAAVFGIIADYNEDVTKITVVGIGRGTSRVVRASTVTPNLFNKDDSDMLDTGRFNSSKNAVAYQAGQLVTGYIEAKVGDTFTIESDKSQLTNGYTGTCMTYDASKTAIMPFINGATASGGWTWDSDNLGGSITIPASYSNSDNSGTAWVRFCIAYTDIDSIVITKNYDTGSGEKPVGVLFNLDRTYVSGTANESIGTVLDESKAYLNYSVYAGTFYTKSGKASDITENSVTVTEAGDGGTGVAFPIHLTDITTQEYRITFDYSGAGKCRTYYRYAKADGTLDTNRGLHTDDTAGASGSADVTIPRAGAMVEGEYEWLIIVFGANTGATKSFTNISLTKNS